MPKLRPREIRDMSEAEREKRLMELRTELSNQRAILASGGAVENTGKIKTLRKTIARIMTVMREASG
ncbi:MAG: 50S ribosomal protein L29 [Candidatus Helarchaeota archaeon]|nr:50S ribosomal protein L29 [Candidatus Helarchaeota archaeon]